jgi:hypothetical protein
MIEVAGYAQRTIEPQAAFLRVKAVSNRPCVPPWYSYIYWSGCGRIVNIFMVGDEARLLRRAVAI